MASDLTQSQVEELRFAVREVLVAAKTVALAADMVHRRVQRWQLVDFEVSPAAVTDALAVIVGLGHATMVPSPLGATPYYQATAAGVLAHERGQ